MKSLIQGRILIINNDIKLALLLKRFFKLKNFKIDIRCCEKEALKILEKIKYDLIIMDLDLPNEGGLSLIQKIRNLGIDTPTIMIANIRSVEQEIESYEFGTNIFHKKPVDLRLIEAQIKSLIKNYKYTDIFEMGDIRVDLASRSVYRGEALLNLTKLEYNLLLLFLKSNGRLYSRDEILNKLFYDNNDSSPGAVDTLISRLRKKLNYQEDYYLIETVFKSGYRLNNFYLKE